MGLVAPLIMMEEPPAGTEYIVPDTVIGAPPGTRVCDPRIIGDGDDGGAMA